MFLFTLYDLFLLLVKPGQAYTYLLIITRDDVVSQRHKLGSAFLSIVFFLGVKNCFVFFFFKFTVSRARPKKLRDFYWLQLRITCKSGWIAQAEKRYCVSKGGKSKLTV